MLDLINNGALTKLREKAPRIRLGKLPLVGRFQVDVLQIREGSATKSRLTGLTRPGHGHKGILFEQGRQSARDFALDHALKYTNWLHNMQVVLSICTLILRGLILTRSLALAALGIRSGAYERPPSSYNRTPLRTTTSDPSAMNADTGSRLSASTNSSPYRPATSHTYSTSSAFAIRHRGCSTSYSSVDSSR